jgi:hypothetical protein
MWGAEPLAMISIAEYHIKYEKLTCDGNDNFSGVYLIFP